MQERDEKRGQEGFDEIIARLKAKRSTLVEVRDPQTVPPGTTDVDDELFKLAKNLHILTDCILEAGTEKIRLEHTYNKKTMEHASTLSEEDLKAIGIVRSDKFKYIKSLLADEYAACERVRNIEKYFQNMMETYKEWVNIYKKVRAMP